MNKQSYIHIHMSNVNSFNTSNTSAEESLSGSIAVQSRFHKSAVINRFVSQHHVD